MATKKRAKSKARVRPAKGSGREPARKRRKQTPAQRAASLRNLAKARKVQAKARTATVKAKKKPVTKKRTTSAKPKKAVTKKRAASTRKTKAALERELATAKRQLTALKKNGSKKAPARKKRAESEESKTKRRTIAQGKKLLGTKKAKAKAKKPAKTVLDTHTAAIKAALTKQVQSAIRPQLVHAEATGKPAYNRPWMERRPDGKFNLRYVYRPRGGVVLDTTTAPTVYDGVYSALMELFRSAAASKIRVYDVDARLRLSGPAAMMHGNKYYDRTELSAKGHTLVLAEVPLGFVRSGPNAMDSTLERLDEALGDFSGRRLEAVTITLFEHR